MDNKNLIIVAVVAVVAIAAIGAFVLMNGNGGGDDPQGPITITDADGKTYTLTSL